MWIRSTTREQETSNIENVLQHHRQLHDELTGDLSRMAAQLKLNSQSFGDTLAKDDKVKQACIVVYMSYWWIFRYYKMLNKLLPTTWKDYARRERDWMSTIPNHGELVLWLWVLYSLYALYSFSFSLLLNSFPKLNHHSHNIKDWFAKFTHHIRIPRYIHDLGGGRKRGGARWGIFLGGEREKRRQGGCFDGFSVVTLILWESKPSGIFK